MKHSVAFRRAWPLLLLLAIRSSNAQQPPSPPTEYDARFTFVRLRYNWTADPSFGTRQMRDPPWHHDYPTAERNLMHIIAEVTSVAPYRDGGRIIDIGDPELFKYPVAYMSEPGFWSMTDQEATNLRDYLLKGGFIIFDDFGGFHWNNLTQQMGRLLPKARWVQLSADHPIFHGFFDIDTFANLLPSYRGQPVFFGLFEDNDINKRMYAIANYNNDIGENWEWSETGLVSIAAENESYKFGVDYIIYGLTH